MPVFTMSGPFPLTEASIDGNVPAKAPGVFVLGRLSARGALVGPRLLGRADVDLAGEIRKYLGQYDVFAYECTASALEAFRLECALFHHMDHLDVPHPERPANTAELCPTCSGRADR